MTKKCLNVLLVEANPGEAVLLIEKLRPVLGFECVLLVAQTITEAVIKLAESKVEAIIIDLNLPDSAGISSYEHLRKSALTVPIIVLAGPDDKSLSTQALEAGADGSLVKGEGDGEGLIAMLLDAVAKRAKLAELTSNDKLRALVSNEEIALPVAFVVERDPHVKSLLEGFLREDGYTIQFADDGYKALDIVRQTLPRLLISEMYAPHLDGLRLTRILRGEKKTKDLPIIIMSPVDASERARMAGANAFLKKPIEKKRVLTTVRAVSGPAKDAGAEDV